MDCHDGGESALHQLKGGIGYNLIFQGDAKAHKETLDHNHTAVSKN